ncbi:hypothetical protein ABKV19_012442 [Rosa sericea]
MNASEITDKLGLHTIVNANVLGKLFLAVLRAGAVRLGKNGVVNVLELGPLSRL